MATGVHEGRKIFVRAFGPPPWVCEECGDLGADHVHHKDEDRNNNDLSNLAGLHHQCHLRHHNVGRVDSPERREKISQGRRGKGVGPKTAEARANMNSARFGRELSGETKLKLSLVTSAQQRKCDTCGMVSIPPAIGRHQKYTGHSGWVDLSRNTEIEENRNG